MKTNPKKVEQKDSLMNRKQPLSLTCSSTLKDRRSWKICWSIQRIKKSPRTRWPGPQIVFTYIISGWAFPSVSELVSFTLEVDLALLLLQLLHRVCPHAERMLVARRKDQLLSDLHPCHHRHWSLLRIQPAHGFQGVNLQPACEGNAGGGFEKIKVSVLQVKAGAFANGKIQKATSRADRGLKVIIDRNFDR